MPTNRRITLAARPVGYPKESDFNLVESPVPVPGPEQMTIRVIYLSLDPYMRYLMNGNVPNRAALKVGDVMLRQGGHRRRHARMAGIRRL
jgi:NADPH-dependent curcumin reductase CurA